MYTPNLSQTVLLIATATAIITYRKSNPSYLKLLSLLLFLTCIAEFIGTIYMHRGKNNILIFNIISVIIFLYYLYYFHSTIENKRLKRLILYVLFILPTTCLINIFIIQGMNTFHTYTYSLSCLVLVGLGIAFFVDFFTKARLTKVFLDPTLWISIGATFYFMSNVSIIGVVNTISKMPLTTIQFMGNLLHIINACFYSFLTISFLCHIYLVKSLSRQ